MSTEVSLGVAGAGEEAIPALTALASINSGSAHPPGVRQVAERVGELLVEIGAETELSDLEPRSVVAPSGAIQQIEVGPLLTGAVRPDAPHQILLVGHSDTVFGPDHPFQEVTRGPDRLAGPGVADLKGGIMVALRALADLETREWADQLGWQLVLVPDEEVGSHSSAPRLARMARRADLGVVLEPSLPDGSLVGRRKGSGTFSFVVRGRAAHAGRAPEEGRSALRAVAELTIGLDELNGRRPGLTVNVGSIHGGGPVNIVPDLAVLEVNARLYEPADAEWLVEQLDRIEAEIGLTEGIQLERVGAVTRQPKLIDRAMASLMESVEHCAGLVGVEPGWVSTGGCCDGNDLAAAGLANIDTMGVHGGGIHSSEEWMRVSSIDERSALLGTLLAGMATGQLDWPGPTEGAGAPMPPDADRVASR